MFKVPFRMIYCDTIWSWMRETAWCFVVIKLWPHAVDLQPFPREKDKPELCPWCAKEMVGYSEPV